MRFEKAINQMYKERERLIIIGLTGRTGSGCTKVAEILSKPQIDKLDLKQCKGYDYSSVDERKNSVIYEYMKENGRWAGFSVIEVSSIILASALELGVDEFVNYINCITSEKNRKVISIGNSG